MIDEEQEGEEESPRQTARRERREAGDRSASAARALMELPQASLDRLGLDEDLRAVVDGARAISSHGARRREERRLAGALRQADLEDVERRLAAVQESGQADARLFQLAERWRARLIDEDQAVPAFVESVGGEAAPLEKLVLEARRERATGRPRGAGRALFRQVMAALRAHGRAR